MRVEWEDYETAIAIVPDSDVWAGVMEILSEGVRVRLGAGEVRGEVSVGEHLDGPAVPDDEGCYFFAYHTIGTSRGGQGVPWFGPGRCLWLQPSLWEEASSLSS